MNRRDEDEEDEDAKIDNWAYGDRLNGAYRQQAPVPQPQYTHQPQYAHHPAQYAPQHHHHQHPGARMYGEHDDYGGYY